MDETVLPHQCCLEIKLKEKNKIFRFSFSDQRTFSISLIGLVIALKLNPFGIKYNERSTNECRKFKITFSGQKEGYLPGNTSYNIDVRLVDSEKFSQKFKVSPTPNSSKFMSEYDSLKDLMIYIPKMKKYVHT